MPFPLITLKCFIQYPISISEKRSNRELILQTYLLSVVIALKKLDNKKLPFDNIQVPCFKRNLEPPFEKIKAAQKLPFGVIRSANTRARMFIICQFI